MSEEIKRKAERLLCGIAEGACPDMKLVPGKGGPTTIVPPFAVAAATGAVNIIHGEDTWRVSMTLTLVTHIDDTPTPEHSLAFGRMTRLLLGLETPGEDTSIGILLHGIGLPSSDDVEDDEAKSAGDVVAFDMTVTGYS